jgi:hypothetical protein
MNSPIPVTQHVVGSSKRPATPSVITVPEQARADSAENDAWEADRQKKENPLWTMAIALMLLSGFAAIVIAFG